MQGMHSPWNHPIPDSPGTKELGSPHPINSIPQDILLEIFRWTLPSADERTKSELPISLHGAIPPMTLGSVCKQWNDIVGKLPSLWASLRLFIEDLPDGVPPSKLDPLQADIGQVISRCLRRWDSKTGMHPIQLQIVSFQDGVITGSSFMTSLKGSSYDRLTKLSLCQVRASDISDLEPYGGFAVLEDLIIKIWDLDTWVPSRPVDAFEHCPRLKRVALDSLFLGNSLSFPAFSLPWHQLPHLLVLDSSPAHFYVHCLKDCPDLQYIFLAPDMSDADNEEAFNALPSTGMWNWPRLSSLTIDYDYAMASDAVFPAHLRFIDPKHLQSLRLVGSIFDHSTGAHPEFLAWLGRAQDSLRSLTLSFYIFQENSLESLFRSTGKIETLELQLADTSEALYEFDKHAVLFNNIKTLIIELQNSWAFPSDKEAVLSFACHWATSVGETRLRRIVIRKGNAWSESCPDPFETQEVAVLQGIGVDVIVEDLSERGGGDGHGFDGVGWNNRDSNLLKEWPEVRDLFVKRTRPQHGNRTQVDTDVYMSE